MAAVMASVLRFRRDHAFLRHPLKLPFCAKERDRCY